MTYTEFSFIHNMELNNRLDCLTILNSITKLCYQSDDINSDLELFSFFPIPFVPYTIDK